MPFNMILLDLNFSSSFSYYLILGNHEQQVIKSNDCNSGSQQEATIVQLVGLLAKKHILLLHAGGDSKRVPWANPMGKVFLPLPYLAADDPDGPVPLLFDHILAIASCARQAFKTAGYFFLSLSSQRNGKSYKLPAYFS